MELQDLEVADVKVLRLAGRFDMTTAAWAHSWLDSATRAEPAHVVVDLSQVNFVDSTALSTLVAGMKRARLLGGDVRLCGLQAPVRMIFELTRLDKAFEIFAREEDAIGAFAAEKSA